MTQTPLYVPAPNGWYPRPGDPPQHVRRWDGRQWTCEIQGPARQRFDQLRSMPPEARSPHDQELLRRLTSEVSMIEDLVLADPTANPPLVAAPAPVSRPDPYANGFNDQAYGQRGFGAAPRPRSSFGRGVWKVITGLGMVSVVILITIGKFLFGSTVGTVAESRTLAVGQCITLEDQSTKTQADGVRYSPSSCVTTTNGKVSYTILSKIGSAEKCGPDEEAIVTYLPNGKDVDVRYCLMPNLKVGQCLYFDDKDYSYDVACTSEKATVKVTKAEDKGVGVACGAKEGVLTYPSANRTYCLAKP